MPSIYILQKNKTIGNKDKTEKKTNNKKRTPRGSGPAGHQPHWANPPGPAGHPPPLLIPSPPVTHSTDTPLPPPTRISAPSLPDWIGIRGGGRCPRARTPSPPELLVGRPHRSAPSPACSFCINCRRRSPPCCLTHLATG